MVARQLVVIPYTVLLEIMQLLFNGILSLLSMDWVRYDFFIIY